MIHQNVDVGALLKGTATPTLLYSERDEYRVLYFNECKKFNQSRLNVLETSKKVIMKNPVKSDEVSAIIRPFTSA
jgi:hypothetical protein